MLARMDESHHALISSKLAEENFRIGLAGYLRRNPTRWRVRRRDYLMPLDFHLARRQITLQAQIDPILLQQFLESEPGMLAPASIDGEGRLLVYLPFASYPKRVVLDFTTLDHAGQRLSLLTRAQGSAVTAEYLFTLLAQGRQNLDEDRSIGLFLILQGLAAISATSLRAQIEAWSGQKFAELGDHDVLFRQWFRHQLDVFSEGFPDAQTQRLERRLARFRERCPIIDFRSPGPTPSSAERAECVFGSLTDIVLFGVHDILSVLSSQAPPELPRGAAQHIDAVRSQLVQYLPLGLEALQYLVGSLRTRSDKYARLVSLQEATERELSLAAVSWVAYVVAPIRVAEPFHFRISELLPLEIPEDIWERNKIRRETNHSYQIHPLDAQATHIEIATEDPEIVIDPSATRVLAGEEYHPPADFFRSLFQDSHSIVHFYTASESFEHPFRDTNEPLRLIIRYKLPNAMKVAYLFIVCALLADTGWNSYEWILSDPDQSTRLALVSVGAGFVGLVLFFLTVQHKRPLVQGKLEVVRLVVYGCLILLILLPIYGWIKRSVG